MQPDHDDWAKTRIHTAFRGIVHADWSCPAADSTDIYGRHYGTAEMAAMADVPLCDMCAGDAIRIREAAGSMAAPGPTPPPQRHAGDVVAWIAAVVLVAVGCLVVLGAIAAWWALLVGLILLAGALDLMD